MDIVATSHLVPFLWACTGIVVAGLVLSVAVSRVTRPRRLARTASRLKAAGSSPGYHLDPLGDAWWRFWDGEAWTSQTCNDRFPPRTQFDDIRQGEEIRDLAVLGAARERVARRAREDRRLAFLAIGTLCVLCVGAAGAAVGLIEGRAGHSVVVTVPLHPVPHGSGISPRREVPSP